MSEESAVVFGCGEDELVGIHHAGGEDSKVGILFVVGGRQYRAGAHRQFLLLARSLSSHGFPVFRFDVRGMGDSSGEQRHFLELEHDIRSALDAFRKSSPKMNKVLLWGLCDGASAAIVSASSLPLVAGVAMVNPWITTDDSAAKIQLKHYYRNRILSKQFWEKIFRGKVDWSASSTSLFKTIFKAVTNYSENESTTLPDIVFEAITQFKGRLHILISEHDITAREFEEEYWRRASELNLDAPDETIKHVIADHTFSSPESHESLQALTLEYAQSLT